MSNNQTSAEYPGKLTEALKKLRLYYNSVSLRDYIRPTILSEGSSGPQAEADLVKVQNLLIDIFHQIIPSDEINNKIETQNLTNIADYYSLDKSSNGDISIRKIIGEKIIGEFNNTLSTASNDSPDFAAGQTMSVYNVKTLRVHPSLRNAEVFSAFFNLIPTHEISQCVPYLDVSLLFKRKTLNAANNQIQAPSVFKFLEGAKIIGKESLESKIITASETSGKNKDDSSKYSMAGMELFSSPQTMVNPDSSDSFELRATPVIDKFRPFLSLESFDVDVVGLTGLMSYKTATLKLILHDRSRLHEITDFIRPGDYNEAEFVIEYGWHHPQSDDSSVFAQFINAMRVREKYGIRNYSFDFDDVGQVKLNLSLYMLGTESLQSSPIIGSNQEIHRPLEELSKALKQLKKKYIQEGKYAKEFRVFNIFDNPDNGLKFLSADKEELDKIKNEILELDSENDNTTSQLKTSLENVFTIDQNTKTVSADNIKNKYQELKKLFIESIQNQGGSIEDPFLEDEHKKDYISLGRVIILFMGMGILQSQEFDDIQFVFYNFNHSCIRQRGNQQQGYNGKYSVANFKIDKNTLIGLLNRIHDTYGSIRMSIGDFMSLIINNFVGNLASPDYQPEDVNDNYVPSLDNANPTAISLIAKKNGSGQKEEDLSKLIPLDFQKPEISIILDSMPASPSVKNAENIARLHIFDKTASAYQAEYALIDVFRDNSIGFGMPSNQNQDKEDAFLAKRFSELVNDAKIFQIIETQSDPNGKTIYVPKANYTNLKNFIRKRMPTLVYGTQTSGVTGIKINSINDSRLATIFMTASPQKITGIEPNGIGPQGLPIYVYPAQGSLDMLGCPVLNFAQQFFLDAETGTTVDNVYAITKITHTIQPGTFNTNVSIVPVDSYGRYISPLRRLSELQDVLRNININDS